MFEIFIKKLLTNDKFNINLTIYTKILKIKEINLIVI
jgi:hypothetical protein